MVTGLTKPLNGVDAHFAITIDGRGVTTAETTPVYNPATKQEIARVPVATRSHLDDAVAAAKRAFSGWSATPLVERQQIVASIGDRLEAHAASTSQRRSPIPPMAASSRNAGIGFSKRRFSSSANSSASLGRNTVRSTPSCGVQ